MTLPAVLAASASYIVVPATMRLERCRRRIRRSM